jgi:hypothetical protein
MRPLLESVAWRDHREATEPKAIVTIFIAFLSLLIACLALAFTIGSFWWLNARQGSLKSFEPHTFAAAATPQQSRVRLPLVLYNTGAKPIVVQDMRLLFPGRESAVLPWTATRSQLMPVPGDKPVLPAVFSILGRTAQQTFIEFGVSFPAGVPAQDCQAQIDVKLGHREGWDHLLTFTFRATRITDRDRYITYSNRPDGA